MRFIISVILLTSISWLHGCAARNVPPPHGFYLSTTGIPSRLERAERSLTVLRELAAPQLDDDAEAGFIWLAIYSRDEARANRLIDRYLEAFPNSPRAETFRKIQDSEVVTVKEWKGP